MNPQIEISTDLYIALIQLRQRGEYTQADVIWRLVEEHGISRSDPPTSYWTVRRPEGLSFRGGVLPNGLRLRMKYKWSPFCYAEIRDGQIWIGESSYDSPSSAASAMAGQSGAPRSSPHINGWRYWEYESPKESGKWHSLQTLRSQRR